MEAACDWLVDTLRTPTAASLRAIQTRHRARDDDFDLGEALAFLPAKQHALFSTRLRAAMAPSLAAVQETAAIGLSPDDAGDEVDEHVAAMRAAAEIVWLFVHPRKEPPPSAMREVIFDLHGVLLALPTAPAQNQVAKICEWLWQVRDERRDDVVPQTILYLLLRSFGGEVDAALAGEGKRSRAGGTSADVTRVYAMRKALDALELAEEVSDSETIRNLLLRCATSAVYLRVDNGRKFLAYLLTIEELREAFLSALLNQIAVVRRARATFYGTVFLLAWKLEKSEWLSKALMAVTEKAICAGTEPFATNLRTVLSAFHANKRITGVDALLNNIYGPVLYRNLMVANPLVRRNAVTIMADAFPIHDPNSKMQDIELTIAFQCGKLLDLLGDPAPIVRKATVEGTARVLGLLWELVPLASAKRMVDVITTKLAFDASSAQVRVAVFEGLEFLVQNHLSHQLLSVALPRLGCLIHDNVERVRLSCLDLLITLKAKRIRSLRYFDVVPLEDLLVRLPIESPAAATKIMSLIVSSYFPLEKKGKTAEEIASSQVRACLSMLHTGKEACTYFYQNVNLHVPPGPLCEFTMRLSAIALDAPVVEEDCAVGMRPGRQQMKKGTRRGKRRSRGKTKDENEAPRDGNIPLKGDKNDAQGSQQKEEPDRVSLLNIVADVLASITPSLAKPANQHLRRYVDDIFGGDALKALLIERGNTLPSRAVCWRIASCISFSQIRSITVLWREQLDTVLEMPRSTEVERRNYKHLLSALMLCGMRWNWYTPLCAVISGWSDAAISGHRTARIGTKSMKKAREVAARKGSSSSSKGSNRNGYSYRTRVNALFALRSCASAIMDELELREEFCHTLSMSPCMSPQAEEIPGDAVELIRAIRKGSVGAADFVLENQGDESLGNEELPQPHLLLDGIAMTWKTLLACIAQARSCTSLFEEVREILQWSAGTNLLKNASDVGGSFASALASLNLNYAADAIALGSLNEHDMDFLECLANNVVSDVDLSDLQVLRRPVIELLRLSFQLSEQAFFGNDYTADQKESSCAKLQSTSKSLLSKAFGILNTCKASDEQLTGRPFKLTVLDSFVSDTLLEVCTTKHTLAVEDVLGEFLRISFENADEAEHNLFASTICNVLRSLAMNPPKGMPSSAFHIYKALLSFIKAQGDYHTSNRAAVNLICFLFKSIFAFYEEAETIPDDAARQFFVSAEVLFNKEYPESEQVPSRSDELREPISDIRKVLADLKKLCQRAEDTPIQTVGEEKKADEVNVSKEPPRLQP